MGDLMAAEEAFKRAHELFRDPQPGLALVRLAQGKTEAAASALRLAIAGQSWNRLGRVHLLAAQVKVAIAAGDLALADAASNELDEISHDFATPAIQATADMAGGAVLTARGDMGGALARAREACRIWRDLALPYEVAEARTLIGTAIMRGGDDEHGRLELEAARAAFQRLGASADTQRVAELLGKAGGLTDGLTDREVEVLRLVGAGKTNRDIADDLMISEHTVARHVHNIFVKLGVSSRSSATAFAYEHDLL